MNKTITWSFYLIFSILFSLLTIDVLFSNPYTETAYLLPLFVVFMLIFTASFKFLSKHKNISDKTYYKILSVFSIIMLIIKIVIGKSLEFDPVFDMGAIYDGAVEWVETGKFSSQYEYFYWFPNNLGAMTILCFFFKLFSLFGITNYFMIGVVLNSVLSVCTMMLVSLICKKLSDITHALLALVIFIFALPFYVIGAAFYTDSLSMVFPVLFIYLYILLKEAQSTRQKIILYVLMSVSIAIGSQIKFTVIIAGIALVIDMLINKNYKKALSCAGGIVIAVTLISVIFNAIIYSGNLDRDIAKERNTPYTHWIMMGLKNEGAYNPDDYNFTRGFSDISERNKAINEEISSRVKERGYKGMFDLFYVKAARDFGDGTYALSDFLDDSPVNDTWLHKYVLYDGEKYDTYSHLCTGMHIAVIFLMLMYSCSFIFKKKHDISLNLYLCMSVFGIFIFLMMWETSARYFTNFVPVIFICAVLGIDTFIEFFDFLKKSIRKSR